jgi:hypothetical protein
MSKPFRMIVMYAGLDAPSYISTVAHHLDELYAMSDVFIVMPKEATATSSPLLPARPAPVEFPYIRTDYYPGIKPNSSKRMYWRKGVGYAYGNQYAASVNRIIGELVAKFKFASITACITSFKRFAIFGRSRSNRMSYMNLLTLKQL